jgi:hypothetical protein
MAFQSNIALYLTESIKDSRHRAVIRNLKSIALNRRMEKLYLKLEREHPEYQSIKAFLPYSVFTLKGYIFYGVMLVAGKIGIYQYKRPMQLFRNRELEYKLYELELSEIGVTYKDKLTIYGLDVFKRVTILYDEKIICSFKAGKKICPIFEDALNKEQIKAF